MDRTGLLYVAGALAGAVVTAQAAAHALPAGGVRCYGIAAAGQNDCGSHVAGNACAGQSRLDYDGRDWKAVKDAAACAGEGGRLRPFAGRNPAKGA